MVSEADLLALSSSLAYASPSCLFLLSLSLTIIHFVLLCSKRAREQSLLIISFASSFLLISILSVVVLGLPFGFLYLAFQGIVWLTSCLAETFPALKNFQNMIARAFF